MKKASKLILWIIFGIVILLAVKIAWMTRIERNRMAFSGASGYIETGEKFGIGIGMTLNEASEILLKQGFWRPRGGIGGTCGGEQFPEHEILALSDIRWRRGTVCLVEVDGKIARIGWYYNMAQP